MAIGRPALDQLLRNTIPDDHYEPSSLHVKLLELPWTDVFTTNYDTLLERASREVARRQYDVVVRQNDLVYSQNPRIIKLHGSFGHKHRLVVTDEDYRLYPLQSPALVNTVRQSLLENTLCLIGFSATDPNFLQWIGWIHDTLGRKSAPLMYMIVSAELTPTQTRMLSDRNIIVIEMSRYADIGTDDHYASLERFIQYMSSQWNEHSGKSWVPFQDIETQQAQEYTEEVITKLVTAWAKDRQTFPGWVILPRRPRITLWNRTEHWIEYPKQDSDVSLSLALRFTYELVWRMERCLLPLGDEQVPGIESVLTRYRQESGARISGDTSNHSTLRASKTRSDHGDMIHSICIALMRYFREEGRFDKWEEYDSILQDTLTELSSEHRSRLYYERCLRRLFQLDIKQLRADLDEWPVDNSQPFWEAKRAALQAEIGLLGTAHTTLETSLSSIRAKSSHRPVTTDYSNVSEESIVMLLLHSVQQAEHYRRREYSELLRVPEEFHERWSVLRQYECDPWTELEIFNHSLSRRGAPYTPVRRESTFDIGARQRTVTWGGVDPSIKQAYRFFRFCEDAGLPFRIPGFGICADTAKKALPRVSKFSPYWAIVNLIRIGEAKAVESMFGRQMIANMSRESVDEVVVMCLSALDQIFSVSEKDSRVIGEGLVESITKVVPEILSRCCGRCSSKLKAEMVSLLLYVYRSPSRQVYEGIDNLVYRLISASSPKELIDSIPIFLEFPTLSCNNPLDEQRFPNPMEFIGESDHSRRALARCSRSVISQLVSRARTSVGAEKRWNIVSLYALFLNNTLSERQSDQFGAVLWSGRGETGFPNDTGVETQAYLTLPHPPDVDIEERFFGHVRKLATKESLQAQSIVIPSPGSPFFRTIRLCGARVRWNSNEAEHVLTQLVDWWDSCGGASGWWEDSPCGEPMIDEAKRGLAELVDALGVMLAVIDSTLLDEKLLEEVDRVGDEIRKSPLPSLQLEMVILARIPRYRIEMAGRIENSLASFNEDSVRDALEAVLMLSKRLDSAASDEDRALLLRVFVAIVQLIRFRRDVGVSPSLYVIRRIIADHEWVLEGAVEEQLISGLAQIMIDTSTQQTAKWESKSGLGGTDVNTMMSIRRSAISLASRLFDRYIRAKVELPKVILDWKSVSESDDEFSEIRNAWGS